MTIESRARGEKVSQPISNDRALYNQAIDTLQDYKQAMEGFLDELRVAHPGQFETVEFMMGGLKSWERFDSKVKGDYKGDASQVRDIVRGTFISKNADDLPRIQEALDERFSVVYAKDNVFSPTETGLRNYNNNIRMPNGHIVETQIMPAQIWMVKDKSHNLMEDAQEIQRRGIVTPEQHVAYQAITKENRVFLNAAVYETGLNEHLDPDFTLKQRAKYTVPFEASVEFNASVDPAAHRTYGFNKAASPFLKGAGKVGFVVLGSLPFIGVVVNGAEAAELDSKLQMAIEKGDITRDALLEYDTILAGHVGQGLDPTIVLGELGVQQAFNDWADRYYVQGELRESLQPSSLALMVGEGSMYVAEAAVDVGGFVVEQTWNGASSLGGSAYNALDQVYDDLSGQTGQMKAVYDMLPVLDLAANETHFDPQDTGESPVYAYPTAHNLALLKSQIVSMESRIDARNNGQAVDRGMSEEAMQESLARMKGHFEEYFEQAQKDGTLGEVRDYAAQYGAPHPDPTSVRLAVPTGDVAINDEAISSPAVTQGARM